MQIFQEFIVKKIVPKTICDLYRISPILEKANNHKNSATIFYNNYGEQMLRHDGKLNGFLQRFLLLTNVLNV